MFLFWLHGVHEETRLVGLCVPPWLMGVMWSISVAGAPQYWQVLLSLRSMRVRVFAQPLGRCCARVLLAQGLGLCGSQ